MHLRLILGEVLPVCGTVGLLGLWLFQQVGVEQRAGELRKVASARTIYQTYQSHNAVFNAVNEAVPSGSAKDRLRGYQTYNYELGLRAIEEALPADRKKDVPAALSAYDGTSTTDEKMARTQKRLELLQTRLGQYEQSLRKAAENDHKMYLVLYLVISALSLLGAVLKLTDRLSHSP